MVTARKNTAKSTAGSRELSLKSRESLFAALAEENPHPKGELHYRNNYTLLVAVVLSAQATDKGVNRATDSLFREVESARAMVALGEEGLIEYIRSIGLYRSKARNIIALSEILLADYGGEVPRGGEALESLPGVGRKTSNVVRNIAFGDETIGVDTHVFRISNRTGLARGANVREVEEGLERRVPRAYKLHAHQWLILHGRYVCTARRPRCGECVISRWCRFEDKTST